MAISVQHDLSACQFIEIFSIENYCIFAFSGQGLYSVDYVEYPFKGNVLLFLTPFQKFRFIDTNLQKIQLLQFHGDFYCIEYHKKEVALRRVVLLGKFPL